MSRKQGVQECRRIIAGQIAEVVQQSVNVARGHYCHAMLYTWIKSGNRWRPLLDHLPAAATSSRNILAAGLGEDHPRDPLVSCAPWDVLIGRGDRPSQGCSPAQWAPMPAHVVRPWLSGARGVHFLAPTPPQGRFKCCLSRQRGHIEIHQLLFQTLLFFSVSYLMIQSECRQGGRGYYSRRFKHR